MKTYPVYLNGNWVVTEETIPVINPANGEAFALMSTVRRPVVAQAIRDADAAFPGWRRVSGKGRGELLYKIAAELERRKDEVARLITVENGKPLTQSLGEVALSVDHLQWFAEEARRTYGRVVPEQVSTKRHFVIRSPVGVVGAISPWNFPLMLAVRKMAPALAAGCTVVLKPASRTPLSAVALAECVDSIKPPKGVFQLVAAAGQDVGAEFLENPVCRKITFTGSTAVGRKLIEGSAKNVKALSLELGGHAPVLVFEDCDLEAAVNQVMMGKFRNSGQSCIAANRIYVQRSVYPGFVKFLTEKTIALKTGDGLDPQTQIGPLIDENALAKAAEHVGDAIKGGAELQCGGHRLARRGYFFEPTVLTDVPRGSLCMFEETFAPIAPVAAFDNEAEGIELANSSTHGLSAYAFTNDLKRMMRLAEVIEAGTIGINDGLPTASQCPFGGLKQSGWGRELGTEGIDAFLDTKHISIAVD